MESKNTVLIVLVINLGLTTLGLGGYFAYDKFMLGTGEINPSIAYALTIIDKSNLFLPPVGYNEREDVQELLL